MGETQKDAPRLSFDREVKRKFHGTEVTSGIYVEQHQGLEAFSKIGGEWDDLFRRSDGASPFLARAWAITFVREGRLQGTPSLITVRADQKLVALLALSVRRAASTKIAEPTGETVPSYLGVLLDPQFRRAIYWMADFIAKKSSIGVLSFQNVSSADQATNELIAELGKRRFISHSTKRRTCHYIRLGCSFDKYLKTSKSAKERKKLRKEDRKLSKYGQVKLLRYEAAEISPEILSRVAAIQEQSWIKRRGGFVLWQPFYQKLMLEMAEAGLGRVWLMTIDGEDAAFKYALISHSSLCLLWTAFKLKYASSLSVGKVLTQATIHDAC
ncbi:MAG: GNAT family N-acetyltransferase, partial [Planctomycetota bacterium]